MITSVNMRPTIGMLYNMRFMSYEQSFALAEFVDNSIQSFLDNEEEIKAIDGENARLTVNIVLANDTLYITVMQGWALARKITNEPSQPEREDMKQLDYRNLEWE